MSDTARTGREPGGNTPRWRPLVDEKLADQLLGRAQAEGAGLLCPRGLPPGRHALAVSALFHGDLGG
jgi:hypothetical protein